MVTMKARFVRLVTIGVKILLKSSRKHFYCYQQPVMEKNKDFFSFAHFSFVFREGKASPLLVTSDNEFLVFTKTKIWKLRTISKVMMTSVCDTR